MYNRYIPQPDGSYRRNRVPDRSRPIQLPHPEPPKQEVCPPPEKEECPVPKQIQQHSRQETRPGRRENRTSIREQEKLPTGGSVSQFLKQLLPKDFDTGDLLIVLLLLLMAGDCAEDQNTALLTLVLYLFM